MTTPGTITTTSTSIRARRPSRTFRRQELLLALPPAALLLAWVGLLLASFGAIVGVIYSNADIVSAPVIGELYGNAPDSARVVLGFLPWYTTLWFELATGWLPFHREIWEVGPWIASLVGIALVAWATAKAAGRTAAGLVAFVLVCASPRLLSIQFASDQHGATLVYVCLLDAFLVLLVGRAGRLGTRTTHAAACTGMVFVAAAGAASDSLLFPAGLVPFVVTGVLLARTGPDSAGRAVASTCVAVGAFAAIGSRVVVAIMHSQHVYPATNTVSFSQWDKVGTHVRQLVQSIFSLYNGDFGGESIHARSLLDFACACIVAVGLVVVARAGRDRYRALRAGLPDAPIRDAHLTFWLLAAGLPALAFVLSSFAQTGATRYFGPSAYGVAVIAIGSIARADTRARATRVLGACIVVSGSVVALAAHDLRKNTGHYPQRDFATFLQTFADGEHLTYGYASYWVAAPVTWETSEHLQVYPVLECPAPHGLCTYPVHVITSWYTPRPQTRSFLIVDKRYGPSDPGLRLGGHDAVVTYGQYTIYVYDYDVAANLGDWRRYGAAAS